MKAIISVLTAGGSAAVSRLGEHWRSFETLYGATARRLFQKIPPYMPGWRLIQKARVVQSFRSAVYSPKIVFIGAWLNSPRKIGAVCPSGSALAKAMAAEVPAGAGLVIELGAGTGVVTEALLRHGVAATRLVAVEQSPILAAYLRKRFPCVTVIEGDAAELSRILPAGPIDCLVSSLPLLSLPQPTQQAIISEMKGLLPGRRLVQFTYGRSGRLLKKSGLRPLGSRLVLCNIPPARVMTFTAD